MMNLREMIEIKEKRGYSYAQLTDYTGIPSVTLQKIFSGKTKNPRKATLDAIEKVLTGDESVYQGKAFSYELSSELPSGLTVSESLSYAVDSNYENDNVSGVDQNSLNGAQGGFVEKKQGEYTLDDYYALPDERRVELIDGVIYDMSSPRTVHQDIASIVHINIYNYIKSKKGKCKVFEAAIDVQLDCDNKTMVQPDVLIVCDRDKIKGFGIYGAPDFVLEILSSSTRKKDMGIKLVKYLNAGVKEYWIIDPKKEILITYNFMDEDFVPVVRKLEGTAGLALYDYELQIDLEEIAESIREYGE